MWKIFILINGYSLHPGSCTNLMAGWRCELERFVVRNEIFVVQRLQTELAHQLGMKVSQQGLPETERKEEMFRH